MASLSRSARSSGPVVVLVSFTLVFAMAWEHDRPQLPVPLAARRESSDPTEHPDSEIAPRRPVVDQFPDGVRTTVVRDGLGSVAAVCAAPHQVAAAGTVGSQLCSRIRNVETPAPCFTGSAAFLCGTVADEETPRSAARDQEQNWSLE